MTLNDRPCPHRDDEACSVCVDLAKTKADLAVYQRREERLIQQLGRAEYLNLIGEGDPATPVPRRRR